MQGPVVPQRLFYKGAIYTIEWAANSRGLCPAEAIFNSLDDEYRAPLEALFRRLANYGRIANEQQFKKVVGYKLWEFKRSQIRFFGNYRPGWRFLISHGVTNKQQRRGRPEDYEKAERILEENDAFEGMGKDAN